MSNLQKDQTPPGQSGLHAVIEGRVQGVGFRMFVQRTASSLNLVGWVRNKYNGNVEVWAEGSQSNLETLLAELTKGPQAATVIELNYQWKAATGDYTHFSVYTTF
jgi:acylphosphatase